MGLETVALVKERILAKFPRSDSELSDLVDSDLEVWVKALCRIHPWWFNTIRPGSLSQVSFPITDFDDLFDPPIANQGRWFHRGWLATEVGVDAYEFKAPFRDTNPDAGFHDAQVSRVLAINGYDEYGKWRYRLPVRPQQHAMTGIDASGESSGMGGCVAWVEHFPEVSILRLSPAPMEEFLLSVEFVLAACPNYLYGDPEELYNRFIDAAPDAVVQFGLMQLAEHFDEMGMYQQYRETLYGNPPLGVTVAGSQHGGILADLRSQGAEMYTDDDTRLEYHSGAAAPYHTRGRRRRGPGYGMYYST